MSNTTNTPVVLDAEIVAPSWERARHLLEGLKLHLRLGLAAQVLLGIECQRIKGDLGYIGRGGDRRSNRHDVGLNRSWDDWCKSELGLSCRTVDRWIDCWEASKARIKKLGGETSLLGLLENPPVDPADANRKILEAAVEKITSGVNQKELLEDLRLVKAPATLTGGDTSEHQTTKPELTAEQLAFSFFQPVALSLHQLRSTPDYQALLHQLPVEAADEQALSLAALEYETERLLEDIRAAKAAKSKSVRS